MITLYELWTKRKPNLNYLRVWGCRVVVRLPDPKLKTLGERGIECIFVGYAEHSKAFRFYVIEPNDSVLINSIIRTRDEVSDQHSYCFNVEDDLKTFDEAIKLQTSWLQMDLQKKTKVGKLSRYTSNPGTPHWQAIQRISNTEDNSSTSGCVFLLGGGAISWASKKQTCITASTMESKFVALAAAGKEAEWLKNLLLEIPLWVKPIALISIRCDSASTLAKAYSQMYNGKSRYLGVRHSMIRELITNRVISIEFVRSQQNLADHLTKGLARDLVIKSAEVMGLKSN
ncbi:hypothetical protein Tco_1393333 [Tanacetum coccineum]